MGAEFRARETTGGAGAREKFTAGEETAEEGIIFRGDSQGHESDHRKRKSVSRGHENCEGCKGAGAWGGGKRAFIVGSHGSVRGSRQKLPLGGRTGHWA